MTPVRLKQAAPQSRVKHSTTEPLRSPIRALRLVIEQLLRPLFNTEDFTSCRDLETVLEDVTRVSITAKVWVDCLIRPSFIMMV